jgi:TRAP-type uncharacterized transport system fused permease subunit
MNSPAAIPTAAKPPDAGPELPRAVFAVAILFSVFQIVTAAFSPISSQVVRAVHVGFVLLMVFALFPPQWGRHRLTPLAWALGLLGFGLSFYHWVFEADLTARAGEMTPADMVVGLATLALVFEAARRVMGWALPAICLGFLAYALYGQHLPGVLAHRGFGFDQVVGTMTFGTEGIYGVPAYVSST